MNGLAARINGARENLSIFYALNKSVQRHLRYGSTQRKRSWRATSRCPLDEHLGEEPRTISLP